MDSRVLETDRVGRERAAVQIFNNHPGALVNELLADMDPEVAACIRELRHRFGMKP